MKGMYTTLVKRELWEHRWIWLAPAAAAVLQVCAFLVIAVMSLRDGIELGGDLRSMPAMAQGLLGITVQLSMVSFVVMVFYLLDCLYAERKDRSILFWKALPVSDFQTVVAKFTVGAVLLPVVTFVLATVVFPVVYVIMVTAASGFTGVIGGWSFSSWLRAELWLLGCLFATILWYAPLAAWFMLTSVVSRHSPLFLTGLPLVALGVCETLLFSSRHVWEFIRTRMLPIADFGEGLQRPGLWIGLAVAAGMLYIVIRVRRYRDDT